MEHVLHIGPLASRGPQRARLSRVGVVEAGAKLRMQENQETIHPELEWVKRIAEGDREAFEQLYAAYQTRLFRYLLRMVGDTGTAEELTNDTMVAAWKAAGSFKGQSKVSTWLFAIARNKALNSLRQHQPETVEVEEAMAATASAGGQEVSVSRDRLQSVMKD